MRGHDQDGSLWQAARIIPHDGRTAWPYRAGERIWVQGPVVEARAGVAAGRTWWTREASRWLRVWREGNDALYALLEDLELQGEFTDDPGAGA